jgi:hypothetical protein
MNTKRQLETQELPHGSVACRQLLHVVETHSLGGSCANRHHTPSPTQGHRKNTRKGTQSHEQSTRVTFRDLPRGIGTRTPHNHHDRSRRQAPPFAQRSRCSKPSTWRQPPRVTRESTANTITSATRSANAMQMHFGSLHTHLDDEQIMGDEGRTFAQL